MRSKLVVDANAVIIGGGFIGLEVAAAARKRKCRVTVIEPQTRLLARTNSKELSDWIYSLHTAQGVDIQLGVNVENISEGTDGKTIVDTSIGRLMADMVIAGIGVQPKH
ncbi:hypothetical protein AL050_26765 [Pseudomonas syringae pv. daphniphylli]|nr:hypothetical protein AL050_26765 [Pseudomonas syringae pv. daphniphylli]